MDVIMKHMLLILTVFLFVAFVCAACTTESPANQTTEPTSEEVTTTEAPEETTELPTTEPTTIPETEPPTVPHTPFSKELVKLLEKIDGLWVDKRYYESSEIDKNVVYPFSCIFSSESKSELGLWFSFQITPYTIATGAPSEIYPLAMKTLSNGMVELTYDLTNSIAVVWDGIEYFAWSNADKQKYATHKIVIDTKKSPNNEVKYYIGDEEYVLVRFDEKRDPSRYQVSEINGYIRIAWQLRSFSIDVQEKRFFNVYRSEKLGEKGRLVGKTEDFIEFSSESQYSFIDISAKSEKKYYYSLWPCSYQGKELKEPIHFGGTWQIPADVDALRAAK